MANFNMPKLGHLEEEATVSEWMKKVGDRVEKGEVLLKVETGKTILEVESNVSGELKEIIVEEGVTVPVQTPIAVIE